MDYLPLKPHIKNQNKNRLNLSIHLHKFNWQDHTKCSSFVDWVSHVANLDRVI